jgi:two-component system, OmpR family, sensor kinase
LDQKAASPQQRALEMLESLLRLPAGDLQATLNHVADLLAGATGADKVDAFLHDAARDSLVALGTSTQPLSALERKLGLDVLPLANGGCTAQVFRTGRTFCTGHLEDEADELRGVKDALAVRSTIGVALEVGGRRRGLLLLASQQADFFSAEDVRYVESIASWIGIVAHRAELADQIGRSAAEAGRRAGAEEMITVLAHDLRNYLSPLTLRLETLRLRATREQRSADANDVGLALRSVKRLTSLVSDILDVARIDQGLFRMRLETVDLGALVADASAALSNPEQPVRVTVQPGGPALVAADAARLRQCIDNLIANAVQKSPRGAPVSVFLTAATDAERGAFCKVEVIDAGPGIPQDILPHLFERYVSGNPSSGGLGLGLYLAKRVAEMHGGDLHVDSAPGKGARFTLALPLIAETGAARRAAP